MESFEKIDNSKTEYDLTLKIILIGHSSVGKTNILTKFCDDKFFENSEITLGASFKTKIVEVNDKKVKLLIWDTAGQERFRSITKSQTSFNKLDYWVKELKSQEQTNAMFMIIGNKCDLEDKRKISKEKGENFAKENKVLFMETSAKDGTNVEKAFRTLIEQIVASKKNQNNLKDTIILNSNSKKSEDKCC
ncbi:ras-related protein rab-37 [Anaeramoeba ignava]|uniref:Ras-related protein rab-37 n=1 Tax=Anaeramoeba ignava TaxID=1746090 RepID=A0A9Q0LS82_ANAIG|nr:ras-related protein rab-37 [Anaeramoeba ignava]